MLYIFNEISVLSIICDKCGSNKDIFEKEESTETLKILGLIGNIYN